MWEIKKLSFFFKRLLKINFVLFILRTYTVRGAVAFVCGAIRNQNCSRSSRRVVCTESLAAL